MVDEAEVFVKDKANATWQTTDRQLEDDVMIESAYNLVLCSSQFRNGLIIPLLKGLHSDTNVPNKYLMVISHAQFRLIEGYGTQRWQ
jgi:hypothetical protein